MGTWIIEHRTSDGGVRDRSHCLMLRTRGSACLGVRSGDWRVEAASALVSSNHAGIPGLCSPQSSQTAVHAIDASVGPK